MILGGKRSVLCLCRLLTLVLVIFAIGIPISFGQTIIYQANFENNTGDNDWSLLGGAEDGNWIIGTPSPYLTDQVSMEISAHEGSGALITGRNNNQDLDAGSSVARSPNISIPQGMTTLSLQNYFSHYLNSSPDDVLEIELRDALTNTTLATILSYTGVSSNRPAAWQPLTADLSSYAGQSIYIYITASDIAGGSKVEAAIDNIVIENINNTNTSIFLDANDNGTLDNNEMGISGVIISAYNSTGLVMQATSDSQGDYDLSTLPSGIRYRLEYDYSATGYTVSSFGPDNRGDVRYATVDQLPIRLGLKDGQQGCETNPFVIVPCYIEGNLALVSSDPAIIKLREQSEGHDFNGVAYTTDYQGVSIADYGDVGTVYGIAWQGKYRKGYASSFHKRYTTFGPAGPDAIYQLDIDNGVTGVIELDQLLSSNNTAGSDTHDLLPASNGVVYDLGPNSESFDAIGKRSFGDIEISADQNTLYVVNLWDRKIYALDVSSGNTGNTSISNSWHAPDATGANRHRPFGLAWHDALLWVGSIDENGQNAFVHSLNPQSGNFQLELTIPLDYPRQPYFGNASDTINASNWNQWQDTPNFNFFNSSNEIAYPQPILSDIEFAANGDMILGFRDRFGDQSGAHKLFANNSTEHTWSIAQGDLLKACYSNGNYVLETGLTGTCPTSGGFSNSGPGGFEFYHWDVFQIETKTWAPNVDDGAFHWETTQGGLLQLDNLPYIISTALDPYDDFSGGIIKFNNVDGSRVDTDPTSSSTADLGGGYTIYEGGDFNGVLPTGSTYAGKANGLGDLEAACSSTLAIGNYVWLDSNNDGIQDPNEPPLINVMVSLYEENVLIGSVLTDAEGSYFFGGSSNLNLSIGYVLSPSTQYELRVYISDAQTNDGSQNDVMGLTSADANSNNLDLIDSDAINQGAYGAIMLSLHDTMYTDYSFDFGFTTCQIDTSENFYTGCDGDGYTTSVGSSTYSETNPNGVDTLSNSLGCDSIVITDLQFHPETTSNVNYIGSSGDGYMITVNGNTYDENNPVGLEIIPNSHGCDSLITISLSFATQEETCNELIFDDFESGTGNWLDGGSDALLNNNPTYASSGNFSFRLRDNTNTSVITSASSYDLTSVDTIRVSFHAYPLSLEQTEDLWFQISDDGGSSYSTVETWANGAEFTNSNPGMFSFSIGGMFSASTRFRFRLDASGNGDYVFLDDIRIDTCNTTTQSCPIVALEDIYACNNQIISIDGNPIGGSGIYVNHSWMDLGSGNAQGYSITGSSQQTLSIDLNNSSAGSIDLSYTVVDSSGCSVTDIIQIVVTSTPLCEIETDLDTICNGVTTTLSTVNQYAVTPYEGMVVTASSGPGLTQDHTILGIQDPARTKLVITLPTWDDHFDATYLNGELLLPEIFETDSYNATGMNCSSPWNPNINGLPRSIIEIKSGSVRYFSSLTTTSTVMTEVFPTNWTTTPHNIIEGNNILRFGIQNTAGPVSGNWIVEAFGNEGYTYLWNTGATTDSITISPSTSSTYSVTVTSPNGCISSCSYDVVVQNIEMSTSDVYLCPGSEITLSSDINQVRAPLTHLWDTIDPLPAEITLSGQNSDSLLIITDINASGSLLIYHAVTDSKGCEAIDTFELIITPKLIDSIEMVRCMGMSYVFGDTTITESGVYQKTDISQLGCDSITVVQLTFTPALLDTLMYIGCAGDDYSITINGTTYDSDQPSGTEMLSSSMGCDSIVYIDLFFRDSIITNINYNGCSDDGYTTIVNGTTYDVNNPSGIETMIASNGCDSSIYVNLIYAPAVMVDAGMPPSAICSNSTLDISTLGASISGGTSTGMWTTTGDGSFDNAGDFLSSSTYTPGPLDISYGVVILNLTSGNPPGTCEPEADAVLIQINDLRCSQFPWVGN